MSCTKKKSLKLSLSHKNIVTLQVNLICRKIMETKKMKKTTALKECETFVEKKLSKIGQWLASGEPVGQILDMRAVLR